MPSDDSRNDTLEPAPGGEDGWTRREMKGLPGPLGALWTRRGDGGWRYAARLDHTHANAQGFIHGGVLMTLMDHALSLLVWEAAGRALCSTVHLDSHFLTALRPPAFVELDGELLRKGRTLVFARGVLRAAGSSVMEASGVWSITGDPAASRPGQQ